MVLSVVGSGGGNTDERPTLLGRGLQDHAEDNATRTDGHAGFAAPFVNDGTDKGAGDDTPGTDQCGVETDRSGIQIEVCRPCQFKLLLLLLEGGREAHVQGKRG